MKTVKVTAINMYTGEVETFIAYRDNLGGIGLRGGYYDIISVKDIDNNTKEWYNKSVKKRKEGKP